MRYPISSAFEFAYASIRVNNILLNLGEDDAMEESEETVVNQENDLEDLYVSKYPR